MQGNVLLTVAIPLSSVRIPITLLPLRVGTLIYPEIASRLWRTPESQATAAATATTERPKVWLKWPNDILIGERKVSGVLIEMEGDRLLIGLGVNLRNAPEVPTQGADRGRPATCMAEHGAHADDASVLDLAQSIARRVASWSLYQYDDSGEKVVEDWSSLSCWDKMMLLRETQERVWPLRLMPDGSLAVRVSGTNEERILLADYLL
jgi:BirA family biotin operon repressor/biotin-[acetyl-CoA-carboxylase] ligase